MSDLTPDEEDMLKEAWRGAVDSVFERRGLERGTTEQNLELLKGLYPTLQDHLDSGAVVVLDDGRIVLAEQA